MRNGNFVSQSRRAMLKSVALLGGLFGLRTAQAHHTESHLDEDSAHHIIYQCNKADPDYLEHILFSAGELLRKYGDDVEIVFAVFGAGLHLLAKHPMRPIPHELQQRASSLPFMNTSPRTMKIRTPSSGRQRPTTFCRKSLAPIAD